MLLVLLLAALLVASLGYKVRTVADIVSAYKVYGRPELVGCQGDYY